ncbi:putative ATPase [Thioploca ingrica]|uniref:histidine kinase n=1 Tax=Thioploca ingrica TaxID=40754 RepID=A0A090BUW4_9GAMM|nr:putative ATPase [Thioploca ingrica]
MITLFGYTITGEIYTDAKISIYRGYNHDDNTPVIIKTLTTEYPTPKEITRFRHEYEIIKELQLNGSVKAYQLQKYKNGLALILEDIGGDSLRNIIANQKLDLLTILKIALQLTQAIGELHQHNIIHKDIKPANIIVNLATGQVKITDFSISTENNSENNTLLTNKTPLEGTLAYMSPEQTGRMNRTIDYRSDFYSLGITVYEMLVGRLPFQNTDAMGLVHCHIAKMPIAPTILNANIPQILSDLVMKLLAKNPSERYQSAYGLIVDWQNCLQQWAEHQSITPFPLGQQDMVDKFQLPQKIYGRSIQIAALLDTLAYVSQGHAAVVMVCGEVGMGKSVLINELQKSVKNSSGFFVSGKFDLARQNLPYSGIIQALRELMLQLLTDSSEQITQWQEQLQTGLGTHAKLLIQMVPELEMVMGQPAATKTPGAEEVNILDLQNRFAIVLEKFIHILAQPNHPLILFLDDLQWADKASLKLLQHLIFDLENEAILLIGGYRRMVESVENHPLQQVLKQIDHTPIRTEHIHLTPLTLEHITQIIADTLHCTLTYAAPLADLVFKKTEGIPFFVREFLTRLYEEGHLRFNTFKRCWQWEVKHILEMGMTDNVVTLTTSRLQKLSLATQEVLKLAAAIGQQFDIKTLALLYQQTEIVTTEALWEAVEQHLVEPQDDTYYQLMYGNLEEENSTHLDFVKITYRFVHERIHQAAYSMLTAEQKTAAHYQLGWQLRESTPPGHLEEHLFDIVNHLNLAIKLIHNPAERNDLARLNLAVGKKAKLASSYEAALNYFQIGLSLLAADSWERQYHLTLALHVQTIEMAYLTGHREQADQLFARVLRCANSLLDQVKVYELKILFYVSQNQAHAALETGLQVLHLLDISLPEPLDDFSILFNTLQQAMGTRQIEELVDLPPMKDKYKLAALRLLVYISSSAYLAAPQLYPLICFTQVKLCINYGNSAWSANAYASYSLILCGTLGDIEAGYRFGQVALKMLERFQAKEMMAKVLMLVNAGVRHWKEPAWQTLPSLLTAIQMGLETGDVEYACYAAMFYGIYSFLTGCDLDTVNQRYRQYVELMEKFNQNFQLHYTQLWQQVALNLQGAVEQPSRLSGDSFDEDTLLPVFLKQNNFSALFAAYFAKAFLCYFFKDFRQALTHARLAERYIIENNTFLYYTGHNFYYSLILLANCTEAPANKRTTYLEQVHKNQVNMRNWARHSPSNYQHKYDLVNAEQARVLGDIPHAMVGYEQAIQGAKAQGYLQDEALANELAAQFYAKLNIDKVAQTYLTEAHYAYLTWGATAKVRSLESAYPFLLYRYLHTETATQVTQAPTIVTTTPIRLRSNNTLDLVTVMKASQAISGEIVLNQLIEKLLHIVVENAGAQKGLFILEKQGQLFIEAQAQIEEPLAATVSNETTQLSTTEAIILQSIALESLHDDDPNNTLLPVAMINYVVRTKADIVLNDAIHNGIFTSNPYITRYQIKSVLCTPLINKNLLKGVLYLENNLITNAFTTEHLNILRLLSTQIAISIENALFYAELEQARMAAESANRAKSTFLMNMSHELRTPLNAILGYSDIIREDAQDMGYEEILPDLDKIQTAGKQLLEIISNVLDISKIEADKMGLNLELVEIKPIIQDVVTVIQPTLGGNTLHVNCTDLIGSMYADRTKIQQILLNLLSNAIKFTHHGTITLIVSRHYPISLPGQNNCDWIHFEIADTGIGMNPQQLKYIFEAFHQVDNSTTRQYGGTGLGLTISDHFCRMMGGKITVTSEIGQGSVFTVQLPSEVATQ